VVDVREAEKLLSPLVVSTALLLCGLPPDFSELLRRSAEVLRRRMDDLDGRRGDRCD
jgi:hypothetical protein